MTSDTVRVIDALAVYKDYDGELEVEHLSNLTMDEAIELGSMVGALIGLGIEGEEGRRPARWRAPRRPRRGSTFSAARPVGRPGGHTQRLGRGADPARAPVGGPAARRSHARGRLPPRDGFISPLDLVAVGLVTAEEAEELHALETAQATKTGG